MSVELPSSSSLYAGRPSPPRRGKKFRSTIKRVLIATAATALLCGGGAFIFEVLSRPRIDRIDPAIGEPGEPIRIQGHNFGSDRGESLVEMDGVAPTSSSYLSWSEHEVSVRLPMAVDSGLVFIVTRHGRSNPKLFMNRARLPVRAVGARSGRSGPFISSLSSEGGPIGSLLVLTGLDFGSSREDATVAFTWNAEQDSAPSGSQSLPSTIASLESDFGYELWSDKEIRVRVPDGAVSGTVTVNRDKNRSNSVFFRVTGAPGVKRYLDRRTYALSQSVNIRKIKAKGPNDLYLWTPLPTEAAYQRAALLTQTPPPLVPDYRGTSIFRFKDLSATSELSILQTYLVQVFAVECEVKAENIAVKVPNQPPLMAHYLEPDERVPSDSAEIQALAKRITAGERNPWRSARLVWDWLEKNIAWVPGREHLRVQDVLIDKKADSYSYALLACALLRASGLPSVPVAGYLADPNRRALRHYWVELYLYGLGWVPLDPILGSGASPGVDIAWEDRARYFGNLDNRHIAFSRGALVLAPMSPNGRRVAKERRWSFQSFYEEAVGGLESYSSFWSDVEVTGMY